MNLLMNFSAKFKKIKAESFNFLQKFWKLVSKVDCSFKSADICEILGEIDKIFGEN